MRRAHLTIGAAMLAAFAFSLVPASSSAAVACGLVSGDLVVEVTEGSSTSVIRNGAEVEVRKAGAEVDCVGGMGAQPTVSNTDTVRVDDLSGPSSDTQTRVDLSAGAFEPGATPEPPLDSDEIEFEFFNFEQVAVAGSILADDLRFGTAGGVHGANLNAGVEGAGLFADRDVTFSGLERVRVDAGGSPDLVSGDGATFGDSPFAPPLMLRGGAADDELTGGASDDDVGFASEPGDDTLAGGAGSDHLGADAGDDIVDGGPGTDTATYLDAPSAVTVDLATGAQQNTGGGGLDALTGVENLFGTGFNDTLRGDAGPNRLEGHDGGDLIDGRGGQDVVLGDSSAVVLGDDVLLVRDGVADTVSCLGGVDSVTADQPGVDSIAPDCENLSFPPVPIPPPAEPSPANDFTFGKAKKNRRNGTAKLTVNLPGAGALELAQTKKLKGAMARAEADGQVQLRIKSRGKAKRRLGETGKASVKAEVTFTPDGGEPRAASERVKLSRKR